LSEQNRFKDVVKKLREDIHGLARRNFDTPDTVIATFSERVDELNLDDAPIGDGHSIFSNRLEWADFIDTGAVTVHVKFLRTILVMVESDPHAQELDNLVTRAASRDLRATVALLSGFTSSAFFGKQLRPVGALQTADSEIGERSARSTMIAAAATLNGLYDPYVRAVIRLCGVAAEGVAFEPPAEFGAALKRASELVGTSLLINPELRLLRNASSHELWSYLHAADQIELRDRKNPAVSLPRSEVLKMAWQAWRMSGFVLYAAANALLARHVLLGDGLLDTVLRHRRKLRSRNPRTLRALERISDEFEARMGSLAGALDAAFR
jgi:hypothetical protein